jgi:glycine cleavage system H lipoate-binding protein
MSGIKERLLSRREFLRETGLSIGATGITALTLSAGCGNKDNKTTTGQNPATMPATATAADWPPDTASMVPPSQGEYIASDVTPTLLDIPEKAAKIADDRWYSLEHIWAKPLGGNQYVLGISEKLLGQLGAEIAGVETICTSGETILRGSVFAHVEGYKMNVDLVNPLSGKVLQVHDVTAALVKLFTYTQGWFLVIENSNPEELNNLFGPRYYVYLSSSKSDNPAPAQNQ